MLMMKQDMQKLRSKDAAECIGQKKQGVRLIIKGYMDESSAKRLCVTREKELQEVEEILHFMKLTITPINSVNSHSTYQG